MKNTPAGSPLSGPATVAELVGLVMSNRLAFDRRSARPIPPVELNPNDSSAVLRIS